MKKKKGEDRVVVELRLPLETLRFITRVAKASGTTEETVLNVILAMESMRSDKPKGAKT